MRPCRGGSTVNESRRSSIWTRDGRLIGEIVGYDGDQTEFNVRIVTTPRGRELMLQALTHGEPLIMAPNRPFSIKEKDLD